MCRKTTRHMDMSKIHLVKSLFTWMEEGMVLKKQVFASGSGSFFHPFPPKFIKRKFNPMNPPTLEALAHKKQAQGWGHFFLEDSTWRNCLLILWQEFLLCSSVNRESRITHKQQTSELAPQIPSRFHGIKLAKNCEGCYVWFWDDILASK